jgi:dTDP-4-dehydrorhamnose 3,5-epimerase
MVSTLKLVKTGIEGVTVVETTAHVDNRGAFSRLFCQRELTNVLDTRRIVQINHSRTLLAGAIRGLHYQNPPHAEMKLVRCLKGRVWDIAIDLRRDSATFLKWYGTELTPHNGLMLVVPEGCAHGFQVLEPESELLYMHTAFYEPVAEAGVRYDDPRAAIDWPLPVTDISTRDRNHPLLDAGFRGITV